jgi:hypothetical protein
MEHISLKDSRVNVNAKMADTPEPDPELTNSICAWITITAPENIHEYDPSSTASQACHAVLCALAAREGCEGLGQCDWSWVHEDRSQIYIWTSWAHKVAYDAYAKGEAHRLLYEKLTLLSTSEVITKIIQFDYVRSHAGPKLRVCWPSITTLYFDQPLSEAQHETVRVLPAMTCSVMIPDRLLDGQSARSFLLSNSDTDSPGDAYVFLDY